MMTLSWCANDNTVSMNIAMYRSSHKHAVILEKSKLQAGLSSEWKLLSCLFVAKCNCYEQTAYPILGHSRCNYSWWFRHNHSHCLLLAKWLSIFCICYEQNLYYIESYL